MIIIRAICTCGDHQDAERIYIRMLLGLQEQPRLQEGPRRQGS